MSTKKKAVAPRGGAQRNGHSKADARSSHTAAALYIEIFAEGKFVGIQRCATSAAAREALRNGGRL